jgi:hypothetical protein
MAASTSTAAGVFDLQAKQGFRVRVPKHGPGATVELLRQGSLCTQIVHDLLTIIVYGEVFGEDGLLGTDVILQRYRVSGPECVKEFDGAFVLVAIDASTATTVVVTDRCNALKCFIEQTSDVTILASSLCFLPPRERALDPVSIVSFVANGVVYNGRTIWSGVRILLRASIHRFSAGHGLVSTSYWCYRFKADGRAPNVLRDELGHLIAQAIKRRSRPDDSLYLGLSGGFDSTFLLGSLTRLGRSRLKCFSYSPLPAPGVEGSDANIAVRIAAQFGIAHTRLLSFEGDPLAVVQANVDRGECRANLCLEWDAWYRLRQQISHDSIIIVGDECLGWQDAVLRNEHDVCSSLNIRTGQSLAPYVASLGLREPAATFNEEIHDSFMKAAHDDLHDTKDALYLDQRLANVLMPWRELFAADPYRVRNPLLDRRLLDFITCVPGSLRRGKRLFRELALTEFPEIFRHWTKPRSEPSAWPAALQRWKSTIEHELLSTSSPADEWIPRTKCLELLNAAVTSEVVPTTAGPVSRPIRYDLLLLRVLTLRRFAAALA